MDGAKHIAAYLYENMCDRDAATIIHKTTALYQQQEATMSGPEQW